MKVLATRTNRIARSMAAGLLAAGAMVAAQAVPLPHEHHEGSITYVSGGVSEGDAAAFRQAQRQYPLSIELVEKAGAHNEFTADARIRVLGADGVLVLDAKADGPFMLVRLPAGRYKVEATLAGHTVESKPLTVLAKGSTHAMIVFPEGTG
ncbi:carboxypeptidase-like regulatory domain-containing protein [soil metagenome]